MKILLACEYSGIVRNAFTAKGHDATSCDMFPSETPGSHYEGDVRDILNDGWDMVIGFPPCTYLCTGSMNWLYKEEGRYEKMEEAVEFVETLYNCNCPKVVIENPIGILTSRFRPPDQIITAYYFGHSYSKRWCLWLKNVPPLISTIKAPPPYKKLDFWSSKRKDELGRDKKSRFFTGVAEAMAEQWG